MDYVRLWIKGLKMNVYFSLLFFLIYKAFFFFLQE